MEKYVCDICGSSYTDLDEYLACVSSCCKKKKEEARKKEESRKHMEEVNAALNGVKQAKAYYDQKLSEFKEKYPEEYKLNFGEKESVKKERVKKESSNKTPNSMEISYETNGKEKPKFSAKINGEKVDNGVLLGMFNDPEVKELAHLLGIV